MTGSDGHDKPVGAASVGLKQEPGEEQVAEQQLAPSLFREVMLAEEREQRWFRQHVQQFLKGKVHLEACTKGN